MIADEIDGAGPAKVMPIGARAYERLQNGVFIGTLVCAMATVLLVHRTLHIKIPHLPLSFGCLGAALLARLALDAHLRRSGRSGAGRSVEAWARAGVAAGDAPDAVVEVRVPRDTQLTYAVVCFLAGFVLLFVTGGMLIDLFGAEPRTDGIVSPWVVLVMALATVAAGSGGIWWLHEWTSGGPRYRLDAGGIIGPGGKPAIPWAAVVAYRITIVRDVLGRPSPPVRDLAGRDGKSLLRFNLDYLDSDDQARLLAALAARFPKPAKEDPWGDNL